MSKLKNIWKNEKGQSLVEYLIIVALVSVSAIAIMRAVGQNVNVQFAKVVKALGGEVQGEVRAAPVSSQSYAKKDLKNFLRGAVGGKSSASDNNDDEK